MQKKIVDKSVKVNLFTKSKCWNLELQVKELKEYKKGTCKISKGMVTQQDSILSEHFSRLIMLNCLNCVYPSDF